MQCLMCNNDGTIYYPKQNNYMDTAYICVCDDHKAGAFQMTPNLVEFTDEQWKNRVNTPTLKKIAVLEKRIVELKKCLI